MADEAEPRISKEDGLFLDLRVLENSHGEKEEYTYKTMYVLSPDVHAGKILTSLVQRPHRRDWCVCGAMR
jgi:hypothetical protein